MDKLVNAIQTHSGSESDLRNLKTQLSKEEGVLQKNQGVLEDALGALDPASHSLGFAYILAARASFPKLDPTKYINLVNRFIAGCTPSQIKLVPNKIAIIIHKFTDICVESNSALKGLKTVRTAVKKLKLNSESLTPIHADLLQLCLLAKCYHIAVPILADEIFEINPETTGVNARDMLLYFYYGGMVYTGLKEYKKAFEFFRKSVSAPAASISAIMVESYKKYVLLSLLVFGKLVSLPKYTSPAFQRFQKAGFTHYQELANAYLTQSTDDLHKVAQQHSESFIKDHNMGLVKQCIQSLYRRNIQRHTQTYLTFSLQDIASSVKLTNAKEAEQQIIKMISSGEIFATVSQKDGMVVFSEDPERYDTNNVVTELDQSIQHVIDIGKKVRNLDETIASSAHYLQKTTIQERGNRWGEFEDFESEKTGNVGGKLM